MISIVPEKAYNKKGFDHIEFRKRVYHILRHGIFNAKDVGEIAEHIIGERKTTNTKTKIRFACGDLLMIDFLPVCSCSNGFFIAETQEEIDKYTLNIKARAEGLYKRLAALKVVKPITPEPRGFLFDPRDFKKKENDNGNE